MTGFSSLADLSSFPPLSKVCDKNKAPRNLLKVSAFKDHYHKSVEGEGFKKNLYKEFRERESFAFAYIRHYRFILEKATSP